MANNEAFVIENVKDTIAPGLIVYDDSGKKVGSVWQIERLSGQFTVRAVPRPEKHDNPLVDRYLYVPFRLITSIDRRELFLAVSRDTLHRDYASPPPRSTHVIEEYGAQVSITTEPSGYDGTPVEVRRAEIDDLKKLVAIGDHVLTSDPIELGTITAFDPPTGRMHIASNTRSGEPLLILPIALVDAVSRKAGNVFLVSSQADLKRMEHLVPGHVDQAGEHR